MRNYLLCFIILVLVVNIFGTPQDKLPSLPKTNVEIPWTELKALIEKSMKLDTAIIVPPFDYLIPSGNYEATISDNTLSGTVTFSIVVLRNAYIQVPLFDVALPLRSPKLNGSAAPITPKNGKHTLIILGPGEFKFTAGFVMELAEHITNFRLNIPRTSSSSFKLTLPGDKLDVKLNPASRLSKTHSGGKTVIQAYLASTDYLFCEWMTALPEAEEEEVEPVVYAEVQSLFSVGEGMVKGAINLSYSVVQGKIDVLRFEVPKDVRILNVSSSNLRDWKMEEKDKTRHVNAYLKFPTGGNINLTCQIEHSMKGVSATVSLPVIKSIGVEREKGYIGVEATTNVEVSLLEDALKVATRIDRSELPQPLWHRAGHPIILAFKYLETPYIISLDIEKHEDLPVKVATADNASFVALMTPDGDYIVRGTYSIRNNLKQFLQMKLPEDAELWSLFVNNRPAKPGKGEENIVLIPMEKSRGGQEATTFPVEIIYFVDDNKLGLFGWRDITIPKVDVPISVMELSLYLPYGYTYTGFGGNMQEGSYAEYYGRGGDEGIFGEVAGAPNVAMKKERVAKMEEMVQSQVDYEKDIVQSVQTFSSTNRGVFPVKISIPQVGTLRRFQKYVLAEDAEGAFPRVRVWFTKKGIKNVLGFIALILSIIAFVYFAKLAIAFFMKLIRKENKSTQAGLIALVIGFIEILILYWITGLFSITRFAIAIPWIIGIFVVAVYYFIKILTGGFERQTPEQSE